jgi:translation initiation factor IF-3
MSKRNRPRTAAQAAHRRRRHAYRSAMNSPEGKAARAAAGKSAAAAKPAAAPKAAAAPKPAAAAATKPPGEG